MVSFRSLAFIYPPREEETLLVTLRVSPVEWPLPCHVQDEPQKRTHTPQAFITHRFFLAFGSLLHPLSSV